MTRAGCFLLAAALAACGTTGGNIVSFEVVARGSGASGIRHRRSAGTSSCRGRRLHIGAVYLNQTRPNSGSQETDCILPGIYTAQELTPLDVDVLSPDAAAVSRARHRHRRRGADRRGLADRRRRQCRRRRDRDRRAQRARRARARRCCRSRATVQINSANRGIPWATALPSLHPICKQRIVSPIRIDLRPHDGGTLAITIDPSGWFANVDFADVPPDGVFPDDRTNDASDHLFNAIRAATATFQFSFQ